MRFPTKRLRLFGKWFWLPTQVVIQSCQLLCKRSVRTLPCHITFEPISINNTSKCGRNCVVCTSNPGLRKPKPGPKTNSKTFGK